MHAKMFCKTGPLTGAEFRIDREATVGKTAENTIALDPSKISRKHARVFFDGRMGCYVIEDLKSRNGTVVDGVRVLGKQKLDKLNIITFANAYDFIFQVVDRDEPAAQPGEREKRVASASPATRPGDEPPGAQSVKKASSSTGASRTTLDDQPLAVSSFQKKDSVLADSHNKTIIGDDFVAPPAIPKQDKPKDGSESRERGSKTEFDDNIVPIPRIETGEEQPGGNEREGTLWLEVEINTKDKRSFRLKNGENIVGRTPSCDIVIEDASISRNHAVITVKGVLATIKDLGSKNHTFFDNQRVNYELELRTQTPITFGLVKALLVRKAPTKG